MRLIESVTEYAGWTLQRLGPADVGVVCDLAAMDHNCCLLSGQLANPHVVESFLEGVDMQLWSAAMAAWREGRPQGVLLNPETDIGSLNTRVVALFADPAASCMALALYVRHLLWSFPLHRVFSYFPEMAVDYCRLYDGAGFRTEGTLVEHAEHAGRHHDVRVVGLLRPDFERWAAEAAPPLRLAEQA